MTEAEHKQTVVKPQTPNTEPWLEIYKIQPFSLNLSWQMTTPWFQALSEKKNRFLPFLGTWHIFQHGRQCDWDSQYHYKLPREDGEALWGPYLWMQTPMMCRKPFEYHWGLRHHLWTPKPPKTLAPVTETQGIHVQLLLYHTPCCWSICTQEVWWNPWVQSQGLCHSTLIVYNCQQTTVSQWSQRTFFFPFGLQRSSNYLGLDTDSKTVWRCLYSLLSAHPEFWIKVLFFWYWEEGNGQESHASIEAYQIDRHVHTQTPLSSNQVGDPNIYQSLYLRVKEDYFTLLLFQELFINLAARTRFFISLDNTINFNNDTPTMHTPVSEP